MSDTGLESMAPVPPDSRGAEREIFTVQDYYRLTYDGRRVRCYLRLLDPARLAGTPPTPEALKEGILADCRRRGIQHPDAKAIGMATTSARYGEDLLIAEGREPTPGRDGEITYKFRTDLDEIRLVEDERGKVNFRELGLIQNVEPKQVLAVATKPTAGRPGVDVFGKPVRPVPGKAARLRTNEYVEIGADGLTATAKINGCVHLDNMIITVKPVYIVRGDVNFSVGNVDFNGTVRVLGSVLEDFHIVARGDVVIDGDVEKATIECEGSVFVRGSILGKEGARINAGKDIVANIAVNADLRAAGDIRIAEELVNSTVTAGHAVRLDGAKRRLMGGRVTAYTEIRVGTVGSENGLAKTRIELRLQPGLLERATACGEEHAHIEVQCSQREGALGKLLALKDKMGRLTSEQYGQVRTLMEEVQRLRDRQSVLTQEAAELRQTHADQLAARIVVDIACYPGTTLVIHDVEQAVDTEVGRGAFEIQGERIRISDI